MAQGWMSVVQESAARRRRFADLSQRLQEEEQLRAQQALEERRRTHAVGDAHMRQPPPPPALPGGHGHGQYAPPALRRWRRRQRQAEPEPEPDPWEEVERRRQEARAARAARRTELRTYIELRRHVMAGQDAERPSTAAQPPPASRGWRLPWARQGVPVGAADPPNWHAQQQQQAALLPHAGTMAGHADAVVRTASFTAAARQAAVAVLGRHQVVLQQTDARLRELGLLAAYVPATAVATAVQSGTQQHAAMPSGPLGWQPAVAGAGAQGEGWLCGDAVGLPARYVAPVQQTAVEGQGADQAVSGQLQANPPPQLQPSQTARQEGRRSATAALAPPAVAPPACRPGSSRRPRTSRLALEGGVVPAWAAAAEADDVPQLDSAPPSPRPDAAAGGSPRVLTRAAATPTPDIALASAQHACPAPPASGSCECGSGECGSSGGSTGTSTARGRQLAGLQQQMQQLEQLRGSVARRLGDLRRGGERGASASTAGAGTPCAGGSTAAPAVDVCAAAAAPPRQQVQPAAASAEMDSTRCTNAAVAAVSAGSGAASTVQQAQAFLQQARALVARLNVTLAQQPLQQPPLQQLHQQHGLSGGSIAPWASAALPAAMAPLEERLGPVAAVVGAHAPAPRSPALTSSMAAVPAAGHEVPAAGRAVPSPFNAAEPQWRGPRQHPPPPRLPAAAAAMSPLPTGLAAARYAARWVRVQQQHGTQRQQQAPPQCQQHESQGLQPQQCPRERGGSYLQAVQQARQRALEEAADRSRRRQQALARQEAAQRQQQQEREVQQQARAWQEQAAPRQQLGRRVGGGHYFVVPKPKVPQPLRPARPVPGAAPAASAPCGPDAVAPAAAEAALSMPAPFRAAPVASAGPALRARVSSAGGSPAMAAGLCRRAAAFGSDTHEVSALPPLLPSAGREQALPPLAPAPGVLGALRSSSKANNLLRSSVQTTEMHAQQRPPGSPVCRSPQRQISGDSAADCQGSPASLASRPHPTGGADAPEEDAWQKDTENRGIAVAPCGGSPVGNGLPSAAECCAPSHGRAGTAGRACEAPCADDGEQRRRLSEEEEAALRASLARLDGQLAQRGAGAGSSNVDTPADAALLAGSVAQLQLERSLSRLDALLAARGAGRTQLQAQQGEARKRREQPAPRSRPAAGSLQQSEQANASAHHAPAIACSMPAIASPARRLPRQARAHTPPKANSPHMQPLNWVRARQPLPAAASRPLQPLRQATAAAAAPALAPTCRVDARNAATHPQRLAPLQRRAGAARQRSAAGITGAPMLPPHAAHHPSRAEEGEAREQRSSQRQAWDSWAAPVEQRYGGGQAEAAPCAWWAASLPPLWPQQQQAWAGAAWWPGAAQLWPQAAPAQLVLPAAYEGYPGETAW